ncbi:MAG TPA: hypothetical protein VGD61_27455 [Pyrinomonadaceae bacterium]
MLQKKKLNRVITVTNTLIMLFRRGDRPPFETGESTVNTSLILVLFPATKKSQNEHPRVRIALAKKTSLLD